MVKSLREDRKGDLLSLGAEGTHDSEAPGAFFFLLSWTRSGESGQSCETAGSSR